MRQNRATYCGLSMGIRITVGMSNLRLGKLVVGAQALGVACS